MESVKSNKNAQWITLLDQEFFHVSLLPVSQRLLLIFCIVCDKITVITVYKKGRVSVFHFVAVEGGNF